MQVIVMEASKAIREVGRTWKPVIPNVEGESIVGTESLTESPCVMRSPSQSWKVEILCNCTSFCVDLPCSKTSFTI